MEMTVKSAAFKDGEMIPMRYTCDGENISVPLAWSDSPANTASFAIICEDPDAPSGTWVHWIVFNIPPDTCELKEHVQKVSRLKDGSVQARTDYDVPGYGGPCPPSGVHRYFFKIYALDTMIDLDESATKKTLVAAMKGHVLAQGQIMGRYRRMQ